MNSDAARTDVYDNNGNTISEAELGTSTTSRIS